MKLKLFGIFFALCFSASLAFAQTKAPKAVKAHKAHNFAAVRHHALYRLVVRGPYTGLKGVTYAVLFTSEACCVDTAHIAFSTADKVLDVISLQGKLPILDTAYKVVSYGAIGSAWLDTTEENGEQALFGTHN